MRTIIKVSQTTEISGSSANRYISERQRDPEREATGSRFVFTPDRDSLKAYAADRYLAGGGAKLRPSKHDLHHIIFAFNRHDARALERLGRVPKAELPPSDKAQNEPGDQIGTGPKTERSKGEQDKDAAYRIAVRGAMELIRKDLNAASLRWTATVHRHTSNPHVHLLLHRDYADATTDEAKRLPQRLPLDWLNGRDENNRRKGGFLDRCLSQALDPLVPPRPSAPRRSSQHDAEPSASQSDAHSSKGNSTRPHPQLIERELDSPAFRAAPAPSDSAASKTPSPRPDYRRSTRGRLPANPGSANDAPGLQTSSPKPAEAQPDRPEATSPQPGDRGPSAKTVPNLEPRDPQKVPLLEPPQQSLEVYAKGTRPTPRGPGPLTPRPKPGCAATSTRSSPHPLQINSLHAPRMTGRNRPGRGSRRRAARPRAPDKFFSSPPPFVNAACIDPARARSLAGRTTPQSPTPT
jgi:hypothetical protein